MVLEMNIEMNLGKRGKYYCTTVLQILLPTILNRCVKCISNALFGFRLLWSPLDIDNKVHIYKRNNATGTLFNLDSNLDGISIMQYFKGCRWTKFLFSFSKEIFTNIWNDINLL